MTVKHENEKRRWEDLNDLNAYCPTEEEIRMHCLEFQKKWSPIERRSRSCGLDTRETFDNVMLSAVKLRSSDRVQTKQKAS
jgi:hypothetical protein